MASVFLLENEELKEAEAAENNVSSSIIAFIAAPYQGAQHADLLFRWSYTKVCTWPIFIVQHWCACTHIASFQGILIIFLYTEVS